MSTVCSPTEVAAAQLAPTQLELHSGVVVDDGAVSSPVPPGWRAVRSPRVALERVLLRQLEAGECVVQFSGGRDSSLVLAVAAHVARREGLPPPRALTWRYPGDGASEEVVWQDLVAAHLGVPWEIVTVEPGASELVGPMAVASLRLLGPTVPPTLGVTMRRLATSAPGCRVLTGEGGDDVFAASRVTTWTAHTRRRRRPSRREAGEMTADLMPRVVRRRRAERALLADGFVGWLRPEVRMGLIRALAREHVDDSWDWRRARWRYPDRRMIRLGLSTAAAMAEREGFHWCHPLLDRDFVAAICAAGGRFGFVSRSEIMATLASDLLPESLLRRRTKARFNNVFAGAGVKRFAAAWDGGGVDGDLVDPEVLRRVWQREVVPSAALTPLQLAVVDALGRGWTGET